jgi:hypothetical protein
MKCYDCQTKEVNMDGASDTHSKIFCWIVPHIHKQRLLEATKSVNSYDR